MAATSLLRHKHMRVDQGKLNRAKRALKVKTDTEAVDRALSLVVGEAEIDAALRAVRGKAKIRRVFR